MSDKYNFAQLIKSIVVAQLKDSPDAAHEAAELAKTSIISGVKGTSASGQTPRETVEQICLGVMQGLLINEQDLATGAVAVLKRMAEAAQELHLDPNELMTWAMRGIARILPMADIETPTKIRGAIDEEYHGAGEVFEALYDEVRRGQ